MERPSRKTKAVNYCETKDFDDEEDFAIVPAPPSKKPREAEKLQNPKKSSKSSSQESNSLIPKARKPLDEKLLDRDLEAAITLSMLNNTDEVKEPQTLGKGEAVEVKPPADENTDPASLHFSNCSVDTSLLGLDEITPERETPSRPRTSASKATETQRKILQEEDEDYQPKLTPDSESDEDFSEPPESEDEEFTVKKVKKPKKEKAANREVTKQPPVSKKEKRPAKSTKPKSQSAASTAVRSPPASKRPSSVAAVSKPKAVSTSPAGARVPKWNPPGLVGRSPSASTGAAVKSPGPGLRLGLSRLVRVKPLHPSVASH